MVKTTSQTYRDLYLSLGDDYTDPVAAAALFFAGNIGGRTTYGLRIEAPSIQKEFVDDVHFGKDPEGLLYVNDPKELSGNMNYNIFYTSKSTPANQRAVVIKFFKPGNPGRIVAQFLARNPPAMLDYYEDNKSGSWADYKALSGHAELVKEAYSSTVTIRIDGISRKVTFNVTDSSSRRLSISGSLTFKNETNLRAGTTNVVNTNSDRIVFYPYRGSSDFTAVFFPPETAPLDWFGGYEIEAGSATWAST